jgi:hypothetical protein
MNVMTMTPTHATATARGLPDQEELPADRTARAN